MNLLIFAIIAHLLKTEFVEKLMQQAADFNLLYENIVLECKSGLSG